MEKAILTSMVERPRQTSAWRVGTYCTVLLRSCLCRLLVPACTEASVPEADWCGIGATSTEGGTMALEQVPLLCSTRKKQKAVLLANAGEVLRSTSQLAVLGLSAGWAR